MADEKPWQFVGTEDTLGVVCDVFVVAADPKNTLSTVYFFQSQTSIPGDAMGQTRTIEASRKARCIARIMLTPDSVEALRTALAGEVPTKAQD
jgi:hypothetical protein